MSDRSAEPTLQEKREALRGKEELTCSDLAILIPGTPDASTVRRWMTRGFRINIDGQKYQVVLEKTVICGKYITTRDKVNEYLSKVRFLVDLRNKNNQEGDEQLPEVPAAYYDVPEEGTECDGPTR
jgi:hypothetical protein